ncbi:MAG: hypothetical protein GY870_01935 [archaeon]|nr:hypothetical protein [archaeon]
MNYIEKIENIFLPERNLIGFICALTLGFLLELTGYDLLMIIAGFTAGIFVKRGKFSFIIGFISVALAWSIYFIVYTINSPLISLLDLIGTVITDLAGIPFSGIILVIVSIFVGGLLGGFGGLIGGFSMQLMIQYKRPTIEDEK